MKLITYVAHGGGQHIGALAEGDYVHGDHSVVNLQAGAEAKDGAPSPLFADMLAFLRGGIQAREQGQAVVEYVLSQQPPHVTMALDSLTLLSPVPRPESIRDCMSFEQHIINSIRAVGMGKLAPLDEGLERVLGRKWSLAYLFNKAFYERPIYFKGNRFSVVGTGAEVRMPSYTQQFDYELEWGIYIGRQGADISRDRASGYVGGYTIFNDFSARDIQMEEMGGRLGPAKGKDFDTGNAIGPYLVTPDEIPDPYNLTLIARVNGEEWSRGSSADMHWTFEDIITYISQSETLYPGEFIGSGTCSGAEARGCGLEMGRFLNAGDVVELEVKGIGILHNRVVG
jgi:2-keto-4-pentenoate hydratase/2-oxohepta-3-ene-1,7-dioic acid hydratase in catechol pathway